MESKKSLDSIVGSSVSELDEKFDPSETEPDKNKEPVFF